MLFILFGSTVEMGKRSRDFFINNGFELIQKYHYVPDDFVMQERFGERNRVTKDTVLNCDFIYEHNGMLVGFDKKQIIDAVRGRKKCLLTTSAHTIDFIRQIKAAYGEYVTVIGTYIDEQTLNTMFASLPNVSYGEILRRINTGNQIKKCLINERKLFDSIVIYGGENSTFNFDALVVQYKHLIEKAEKREKELNDKMYVEMPYAGNDNYIFVSYSHSDIEIVFPVLRKLQLNGCRIWYDEGINGGENWRKILASKIQSENCKDFLLFSSNNSTNSRHVKAEINAALNCDKKITTIKTDDATFDIDIEMYLQTYQCLFTGESNFHEKLFKSVDSSVRLNQ